MSEKTAPRRGPRAAADPARKFDIVPIFEIEANIPLLRAYRQRNRARFNQWKKHVMDEMARFLEIIESSSRDESSLLSGDPALTACKIGQIRLETKKDPTGQVWVRTCIDYWCQNATGGWVPNGTSCGLWTVFEPTGARVVEHAHGEFVDRAGNGRHDPPPRDGRDDR